MKDLDFTLSLVSCLLSVFLLIPLTIYSWAGYLYGLYIHEPLGHEILLIAFTALSIYLFIFGFKTQIKIFKSFRKR